MESIKLVIWDLDDTFWNGVLSEVDVSPIPENIEIVRTLTDRGIINSICSKNDLDAVKKKLTELGVWDLFVFPSVDWTNKGERIKQQIDAMQLRPVNVLFIDDSVVNLNEAKFVCPELNVADPGILSGLLDDPGLQGKDDRQHSRLEQYKILEEKAVAREASATNEEFLFQSQIQCEIIHDWIDELDRVYELIHRTNQLNFTKDRISKEQTADLFITADDSGLVHVSDKYGDHGFVGFYAVKDGVCLQFCFSCRTMGMGIEQYVYAEAGFPTLVVVGEVAGELNAVEKPAWINQEPSQGAPMGQEVIDKAPAKKAPNLLIYGGCILRPIHSFVEAELGSSQAIYDALETPLPVTNIPGVWKYDESCRESWLEGVSTMKPEAFDPRLGDVTVDYLLICLQAELRYWKYSKIDDPETHFYTSRLSTTNARSDILAGYTASKVTQDDLLDELRYLADHLQGKLIILTLPEYVKTGESKSAEYRERIALNDLARTLASEKSNVCLLAMGDYMTSEADSLDGSINHYTRQTGWKIALGLLELMGAREQACQVAVPPPVNALRIKTAVQSSTTDDVPEYAAYIRNGYFHVDCEIANRAQYQISYVCHLNRRSIEETDYAPTLSYRRALTQTGSYWATVSVRDRMDPSKEYRFNTQQVPFSEFNFTRYMDPQLDDFDDYLKGVPAFFQAYPDATRRRRRMISQIMLLKSHGVTIADYFIKRGITDVSFFSDAELYPILLQSLEGVNFHIRYRFTDDLVYSHVSDAGFGSCHSYSEWTGSYIGPLDTVLVAKPFIPIFDDTPFRVKQAKATPVLLYDILDQLVTDLLFNRLLPDLLQARGLDLPIVVFQMPSSAENRVVCSASDKQVAGLDESRILRSKAGDTTWTLPSVYEGIPLEELKETLRKPQYFRRADGVTIMRDSSGKHVNILGGFRRTPNQPTTGAPTVHMFGHQAVFGAGVCDDDTIASRLQLLLGDEYRVENRSNYWDLREWEENMLGGLIRSTEFGSGDVICIASQSYPAIGRAVIPTMRFEVMQKPLICIDCSSQFQAAGAPDLFLLGQSSLAPWGNQKVAELLRDTIHEARQTGVG